MSTTTTDVPLAEDQPDPAATGALRISLPGSDVQVGPVGYLAAERRRLDGLTWRHFDVQRCSATVGAELSGIRLADDLPDEVIAEVARALAEYKVIFFRAQPMTAAEHVAFARRFGDLEVHPFLPANAEAPEVVRFAKSADVGGYENGWHHDVTWRAVPSKGAVLHALEVPPSGGDTVFSDAHAALESLDDDLRARIDDLLAVHDFSNVFGHGMAPDELARMRDQHPPVEHPVVVTHEVTGRDLLYVNRFFVSHLAEADGTPLDRDESRALIDRLCRAFELLEHQTRFRWEPESVAFWDNRAVQHYACSDYWPDVRVMERASIIGSAPARVR
ncbi:TauD/TfdA dioxygenase family protein [Dermatobacter hominis]|uniref:TauD/TfdA dioxygenase family protein n=1 Tax=Dermatobacter hominis TaxID=2884263 RepID=UPI001D11C7EA|nr:TauD/TfdA family dioxygenase [Dermatobacter hominis]UDY35243.1 TauD/TfdA family dioxygenase [Dermatobacter hominis]